MKSPKLVLKSVLLMFLLAGCTTGIVSQKTDSVLTESASAELTSTSESAEAQSQTAITSQDGVVTLTVPQNWQNIWTEAQQDQWSLLIGERSKFTQIALRSIAKADYPTITPEMHAEAALAAGTAPFADAEILKEGESLTVNGYPAVLYHVEGTTSGQRLVALSLSVETPDYYHGILIISPELNFAQQQDELNQIIQSLQES
jgi:hypothetical protein